MANKDKKSKKINEEIPDEREGLDDGDKHSEKERGGSVRTVFLAFLLTCATLAAIAWLNNSAAPVGGTPETSASQSIAATSETRHTTAASSGTTATTAASTFGSTVKTTTATVKTTTATAKRTTVKTTTTVATTTANPRKNVVVCIDAGHGGNFPGAIAEYGGKTVYEKEITLDLALRTEVLLTQMGYTVVMTRSTDRAIINTTNNIADVTARVNLAKNAGADLLVSFHCNAYAGSARAWGPIVYYREADPAYSGIDFANVFAQSITAETSSIGVRAARIKEDGEYAILKGSGMPSILFETGFLTDSEELSLMMSESWRQAMSRAIANAVESSYRSKLIS